MDILYALLIGLAAGWLAGKIMGGKGFGLVWNIVIGLLGSAIGHFLLGILGFGARSTLASLITATGGAIVLLAAANAIASKQARRS